MYRFIPLLSLLVGPALACPQYDTVVAAVQGGDKAGAEVLYDEIIFSSACDDAIREWVGDYLARENFLASLEAGTPEDRRVYLTRALKFETHWRSFAELGVVAAAVGLVGAAWVQA